MFTAEHFASINNNDRRILRDLLHKRKVYIKKGRGIKISDARLEVVREEQPWPVDDPEHPNASSTSTIPQAVKDNVNTDIGSRRKSDNSNDSHQKDGGNLNTTECSNRPRSSTSSSTPNNNISNLSKAYFTDNDRYNGLPNGYF